MTPFSRCRRRGVTLVEVLVALALTAVIAAALYSTYIIADRTWKNFGTALLVKQQARNAVTAMRRELREAHNVLVIRDEGSVRINFYRPGVGIVSYIWYADGPSAGELVRRHYTHLRVLARDISRVNFDYRINKLKIALTASEARVLGSRREFTLQTQVAMRSKTGLLEPKEMNVP